MTLKYLSESEAEKLCASTLESWVSSAGYKGCYSAADTREAIEDAKRWAIDSATARQLVQAVETNTKEILVIGMVEDVTVAHTTTAADTRWSMISASGSRS